MKRADALERYEALYKELMSLHREHGNVLAVEKEAKVQSYVHAQGTDRQREHSASYNALPTTKEAFKLDGEIKALEAERDFLQYLITYGAS